MGRGARVMGLIRLCEWIFCHSLLRRIMAGVRRCGPYNAPLPRCLFLNYIYVVRFWQRAEGDLGTTVTSSRLLLSAEHPFTRALPTQTCPRNSVARPTPHPSTPRHRRQAGPMRVASLHPKLPVTRPPTCPRHRLMTFPLPLPRLCHPRQNRSFNRSRQRPARRRSDHPRCTRGPLN